MLFGSVAIALAALLLFGSARLSCAQATGARITQGFYSEDDGKSYFADDVSKPSPFDHDGKQAYRAIVYRSSNGGSPFVAYLTKVKPAPSGLSVADAIKASKSDPGPQVKKPGSAKWIPLRSPEGKALVDVHDAQGNPVEAVFPSE